MPVAALVDDSVRLQAYMRIDALRRLLREGDVVTGAALTLDPAQSARFYREVKMIPAVAGVALRDIALRNFRDTMAENRRASARLNPSSADSGRVVTVTAPIAGVVLKRLRESEIVADLLSTDAVRVRPGARALIEEWGGQQALDARVRRVEPAGFTKISALGVEEQRVNVILDFADPEDAWAALGDAYRVEVRIVEWEAQNVQKVPTSALFREGAEWAVYVVENSRARRTIVKLGHQTGQEAEVSGGLSDGDRVVLHPGDTLTSGARIRVRSES